MTVPLTDQQDTALEGEETAIEQSAEAIETSSPDVTQGASTSDAADNAEETDADKIAAEFLKKYGAPEEESDGDAAASDEETPDEQKAAREKAPEPEVDEEDDEHRIPDEEFKSLSVGVRRRIGRLSSNLKDANRKIETMTSELETAKDSQTRLTALRDYATQRNMTAENVTQALEISGKLASGDFEGFLKDVMPMVQAAQQALGQTFAPDLQDQVDSGYLSEEAARELTKARAEAARAKQMAEASQAQLSQRSQQEQQQSTLQAIGAAVSARERELQASDPDYARKQTAVRSILEMALKRGAQPRTPQEAVDMVNDAYMTVSDQLSAGQRQKRTTAPTPRAATSPQRGAPAPSNLLDAMAQSEYRPRT